MASLMLLPQELHSQAIKHLPFPSTILLRFTSRYFYNLIQPLSDDKLSRLEYKFYCIEHDLRYCADCHRLRPGHNSVPMDPFLASFQERNICIECGMHNESYRYPRGTVFKSKAHARVMGEDCSDLPKDSLRRHEDLCQECWRESEQLHGSFPLWKECLSGEEVLGHQAKLFQYGEVASPSVLQEMLERFQELRLADVGAAKRRGL